ncbi:MULTISPECIES: VirB4-like conjugal transfer ATPase, CD1110 family [Aerococcus]|uniref:Conjugal transfer protein TraE n=1 Tax=Aerococcus tenax TaxID=3078812 RepID=A0A5N1BII3_9LACT|nr:MULTISPECIES: ATP-binding protein [Aerococcus]KAA9237653.1 conjugal transfer protein TraE [Aerococcus urinae]MDK6371631.1 ATP-binding protein [Aerococcus urinae]MDK6597056.1 ATP-binding protein [Aerococcus urinae]MDK7802032.1 ATP-binding protein [Aerococcus urinae]MDK8655619.1 ATP-binding protein [Aerococcus urinae]
MAIDLTQLEAEQRQKEQDRKDAVEEWVRSKRKKKNKNSTQGTLTFDTVTKDTGIIISDNKYSKIIEFEDLNYQLAPEYRQSEIFNEWCNFLNYFDSSINVQLLLLNRKVEESEINDKIRVNHKRDQFEAILSEYDLFLHSQLTKGNNSMVKQHFIVITVEAQNLDSAELKLSRVENDVIGKMNQLGVDAHSYNFTETVMLLHKILNPSEIRRLADFKMIFESGLSVKDMIAPMAIKFTKNGAGFKLNSSFASIGYMEILASEMSDSMLAELTDLGDNDLLISFKISPMDQNKATKFVKNKISDLDAMKIEEQRKAVRSGYDMDILPPDLRHNIDEAQALLDDLLTRNERSFLVTITVMCAENDKEKLESSIYSVRALCQKYNINFRIPYYQQEEALMTTLPIGVNQVSLDRMLTTSSTAIFIPFITQELFQTTGKPQYYGLNQLSQNMIMADRRQLRNPNGLILGTPGSGKSFGAKREIVDVFLTTDDDIIITDPEAEYAPLVRALNGSVIELSANSKHHVNPMDINLDSSEEDPIALKADFVTSMLELILGGNEGLSAVEKSIISRVTIAIYNQYMVDPKPENMPTLQELYEELLQQDEPEAKQIAKGMEMYVTGAFNFFNHRTNIDMQNRVICFDIQALGNQLKKLGMLIVQDATWNRVSLNRSAKKATRVYIDEFHLLLREEQTASYSIEIWKRFRKWGGVPTGITQNIKDLLGSLEIENIFENSDFVLLFNQAHGDREILAEKLQISPSQKNYITNAPAGEGLIIYDNIILPFRDKFPTDTRLYALLSTKPGENNKIEE